MDVSMEEEDIDMYSSPWENYLRLLNTVETLETGVRLSEDWYEEHKTHILKYRDVFMDFSTVNQEIHDESFRKKAIETETILSSLVHEVKTRGIFTVKMYLLLNKHMKALCEFIHGEDELLEMLGRMRM